MQTMPETAVVRKGRSASMGMLLAVVGGLALYQMTSLVLGSGGTRQLALSLNLPSVDVVELPATSSNVGLVVGTLATPMPTPPAPAHRAVHADSPAARPAAVPTTKGPTPTPAPNTMPAPNTTPEPTATPRPKPPVRPTPTPQPVPDSGDD